MKSVNTLTQSVNTIIMIVDINIRNLKKKTRSSFWNTKTGKTNYTCTDLKKTWN